MSEQELFDRIIKAVSSRIPVEVDLWDTATIAEYLKRTPQFVRETILPAPTFPAPIRLPSDGRARALYKAREVITWANGYQERKSA